MSQLFGGLLTQTRRPGDRRLTDMEVRRALEWAVRMSARGDAGGFAGDDAAGTALVRPPAPFLARIIGVSEPGSGSGSGDDGSGSGSGAAETWGKTAYAWIAQYELPDGTTVDDPADPPFTGDADYWPAIELNDSPDVPTDGSIVVELRPSDGGDYYTFDLSAGGEDVAGKATGPTGHVRVVGDTPYVIDGPDGATVYRAVRVVYGSSGRARNTGDSVWFRLPNDEPVETGKRYHATRYGRVGAALASSSGSTPYCTTGDVEPTGVSFALTGVADGTSSPGGYFDKSFDVPATISSCDWRYEDGAAALNGTDGVTVQISRTHPPAGDPAWTLQISRGSFGGGAVMLALYEATGDWDGVADLTLTLVSSSAEFTGWPATITITPEGGSSGGSGGDGSGSGSGSSGAAGVSLYLWVGDHECCTSSGDGDGDGSGELLTCCPDQFVTADDIPAAVAGAVVDTGGDAAGWGRDDAWGAMGLTLGAGKFFWRSDALGQLTFPAFPFTFEFKLEIGCVYPGNFGVGPPGWYALVRDINGHPLDGVLSGAEIVSVTCDPLEIVVDLFFGNPFPEGVLRVVVGP